MRTMLCARAGGFMVTLGACVLIAGAAQADLRTERPGSILIFPKVVRDNEGLRDTTIQISNTGNNPVNLRCFYLNGQKLPTGQVPCTETDFFLTLTKQQPTHWEVSTGRSVSPFAPLGSDGAGLNPGLIPPVPVGFRGALVCAEVDPSDAPIAMNQVKGEAILVRSGTPDISAYNAIAIQGNATPGANNKDDTLSLDNAEYNACPRANVFDIIPDGGTDPMIEAFGNGGLCSVTGAACNNGLQCAGTCANAACTNGVGACTSDADCAQACLVGQSGVQTRLTLLPCNLDFNSGAPTTVAVNFSVHDELERQFSSSTTITCWASFLVGDLQNMRSSIVTPSPGAITTQYATVRMTTSSGGPVVGVAESFHSDSVANTGGAAFNLHNQGICVPTGVVPRGCNTDDDCGAAQACVRTSSASIQLADH